MSFVVKEVKLLDITFAAGVEKLDKEEREVSGLYLRLGLIRVV